VRQFTLIIALSLVASPIWAEDWQVLTGGEIQIALEGRRLVYDSGARQEFRTSGRTLYNAGSDSWGYWEVRNDQYCSVWPPSDLWACYGLEVKPPAIRFVGSGSDVTEGRYVNE